MVDNIPNVNPSDSTNVSNAGGKASLEKLDKLHLEKIDEKLQQYFQVNGEQLRKNSPELTPKQREKLDEKLQQYFQVKGEYMMPRASELSQLQLTPEQAHMMSSVNTGEQLRKNSQELTPEQREKLDEKLQQYFQVNGEYMMQQASELPQLQLTPEQAHKMSSVNTGEQLRKNSPELTPEQREKLDKILEIPQDKRDAFRKEFGQ